MRQLKVLIYNNRSNEVVIKMEMLAIGIKIPNYFIIWSSCSFSQFTLLFFLKDIFYKHRCGIKKSTYWSFFYQYVLFGEVCCISHLCIGGNKAVNFSRLCCKFKGISHYFTIFFCLLNLIGRD